MAGGYQPPGGWNQQTMSGWNPNQANASQSFGLLDFLGPNPNQSPVTMPNGGGPPLGHMTPQARRDGYGMGGYASGGKFQGTPFQGSVSNFMVGGSPVILGSGDPNQRYRNRGTDFGG